jgi:hypothetical protein
MEDLEKNFKAVLDKMYKLKIDSVFLTDTTSISYGYVLRGMWKKVYPRECPKFFRIDPHPFKEEVKIKDKLARKKKEQKKLEEIIKLHKIQRPCVFD